MKCRKNYSIVTDVTNCYGRNPSVKFSSPLVKIHILLVKCIQFVDKTLIFLKLFINIDTLYQCHFVPYFIIMNSWMWLSEHIIQLPPISTVGGSTVMLKCMNSACNLVQISSDIIAALIMFQTPAILCTTNRELSFLLRP